MRPQNSSRSLDEETPRQIEARQPVGREDSLVRQVVNREHARRAAEDRMSSIERLQIDRREPGLPVVRVHDGRAARRFARRTRARRGRAIANRRGLSG